jgi:hypothetical protein
MTRTSSKNNLSSAANAKSAAPSSAKAPTSTSNKPTKRKFLPGTPSISDLTVLQSSSPDLLMRVARDSCIVFPSIEGVLVNPIPLIQARELAHAELTLTRLKLDAEHARAAEGATTFTLKAPSLP